MKQISLLSLLSLTLAATYARAGLPPVPVPAENPLTEEKRVLGKILFWDEQLSSDNSIACGSCHIPSRGGTDPRQGVHPGSDGIFSTVDDVRGSPGMRRTDANGNRIDDPVFGFGPQVTPRSSQPVFGALWADELFWDGRAPGEFRDPLTDQVLIPSGGALESQSLIPIVSPVEMAFEGRSWADVTDKLLTATPLALATNLPADVVAALAIDPSYPELFESAFGDPAISPARIAFAIASYERTLVPNQTPWDLYDAGDLSALTAEQQTGLAVFVGDDAVCRACHALPSSTQDQFMNTGVRPSADDLGRQLVTGLHQDRGKFKVPTLRNVAARARYMHNGTFNTIGQVLDFYMGVNGQQSFPENRDPHIAIINIPAFVRPFLLDFVRNGLRDPRVDSETFPFDRPTLQSEHLVSVLEGHAQPQPVVLHGAHPNPFNPSTEISFSLREPANISLSIWDSMGRRTRSLPAAALSAGRHSIPWNGLDEHGQAVASGVYHYRILAGDEVVGGKLTVVK